MIGLRLYPLMTAFPLTFFFTFRPMAGYMCEVPGINVFYTLALE